MQDMGELALLRSIRERAAEIAGAARGGLRLGIGDDCALLRPRRGEELAVTTDLSIEGRHFRLDWHTPESIGHRTLARGLSDLASMGARPVAAFLSLGVPRGLTASSEGDRPQERSGTSQARSDCSRGRSLLSWTDRFFDGLFALAAGHRVPLAGGDLAESPIVVADIVLTGAVPEGTALLRSTAGAGDRLYVTGSLGGAAAELACLGASPERFAEATSSRPGFPHLFPQPRIAQGLWLRKRGLASAATDLSDGLSTDLTHLCEESGVRAEVEAALLPVAAGATLEMALHGGEDYELLFAAPPSVQLPRSIAGVPIRAIGRLLAAKSGAPAVTLVTDKGMQTLKASGWQHFT